MAAQSAPAPYSADATATGLLRRLAVPDDTAAWAAFNLLYRPRVAGWLRHWGLQAADADDVLQIVFLKVFRYLPSYERAKGGKFRTWLQRVARNAFYDYLGGRAAGTVGTGETQTIRALGAVVDRRGRAAADERPAVAWKRAVRAVRAQVSEKEWKAFKLLHRDRLTGKQAAARLNTTLASVYSGSSRVRTLLMAELSER